MPGRNDFDIKERVSQKAVFSGEDASIAIAPNRLSKAKISMPPEKHQVANERCLRQIEIMARPAPNKAAAKARMFKLTIGSE